MTIQYYMANLNRFKIPGSYRQLNCFIDLGTVEIGRIGKRPREWFMIICIMSDIPPITCMRVRQHSDSARGYKCLRSRIRCTLEAVSLVRPFSSVKFPIVKMKYFLGLCLVSVALAAPAPPIMQKRQGSSSGVSNELTAPGATCKSAILIYSRGTGEPKNLVCD
jgi:hypothetical protein